MADDIAAPYPPVADDRAAPYPPASAVSVVSAPVPVVAVAFAFFGFEALVTTFLVPLEAEQPAPFTNFLGRAAPAVAVAVSEGRAALAGLVPKKPAGGLTPAVEEVVEEADVSSIWRRIFLAAMLVLRVVEADDVGEVFAAGRPVVAAADRPVSVAVGLVSRSVKLKDDSSSSSLSHSSSLSSLLSSVAGVIVGLEPLRVPVAPPAVLVALPQFAW